MIESFRHKGHQRLDEEDDRRRLPADMVDRIRRMLAALHAAATIEALNQPTLRLHMLKGDLKEFWAIMVRANWRIVFRFKDGNVFDGDFVDYR